MPSVIIPAYNEEARIAACIASVLADEIPDLDVIVVPNACVDRTAEIARTFGEPVTVVETSTPGKTNALNLGEQSTIKFPRAFIDGDIVLEPGALRATFETLGDGVHIASPPPKFELRHASIMVRWFYGALRYNPYFGRGAPNGSGVFALTEAGRARWERFPDVISDDGFVARHFDPEEQATAAGPGAEVLTPTTLRSLVAVQARSRTGTSELSRKFPELARRQSFAGYATARGLLKNPLRWPSAFAYAYVRCAERLFHRKARRGRQWLRDESSRSG